MRKSPVFGLSVLLAVILFNFQNCAPVSPEEVYAGDTTDPELRIIDDWNDQKLNFIVSEMVVHSEVEDLQVEGFCSRQLSEELVTWNLYDDPQLEEPIAMGTANCEGGGFRFNIESLGQLECDREYLVTAGFHGYESADVVLTRLCSSYSSAQSN